LVIATKAVLSSPFFSGVVTPLLSSPEDPLIAGPFYENKSPGYEVTLSNCYHRDAACLGNGLFKPFFDGA
jgi:hypothetical protein